VLAAIAGAVALIPRDHSTEPKPVTDALPEPAIPVSTGTGKLTRADRLAIDRTLDRFVPAVVERQDVAAGYDVVTPTMREQQTRAQWAKSDPPVMLFRTKGRTFHGWTTKWRQGSDVSIELILQPPKAKGQSISFDVALHKTGARWLVDSIAPAAIFNSETHRVTAAKDFGAQGGTIEPSEQKGALSGTWIVVPLGLVGLVPLILLGFWIASWVRNERIRRAYDRGL